MAAARQSRRPLLPLRARLLPVMCLLFAHDLRSLRATQMQTTHADYPPFSLSCFKAQCGSSAGGRGSGSLLLAASSASVRSSSVAAGSVAAAAVAAADDAEWAGWRVQPLSIDLVSSAGEYLSACLSTATDGSGKGRDGGRGLLRRLQDDIAAYFNDRCLAVTSAGSAPTSPPAVGAGDGDLGDDDRNLDPFAIDSNAIESAARGGGCLAKYDSLAAVSVRYRCERRRHDSGGNNVTTVAAASASPPTQQPSTLASQAGDFSGSHRQSDGGADDAAAESEISERAVKIAGSSTPAADAAASTVDEPSSSGSVVVSVAAPEATAASTSRFAATVDAEVAAAGVDKNGSAPFLVIPNPPQLTALLDGLETADVVAAAAVPAVLFFVVIAVVVTTAIVCWKRRLILVVRFSSHPSSPPSSTVIASVAAPDAGPAEADAPPHYVAAERVCSTSLPVVGPGRSSISTVRQRRLSQGSGVGWCCRGSGAGCCFPRRTCLGACERRADAAVAAATATAAGCDGRSAPRRAAGDGNSYAEIEYDGDDVATGASSTYDDPELGRSGRSTAGGSGAFVSSEHLYHTPLDCATPDEAALRYSAAATAASLLADGTGGCRNGGGHLATQRASSSPTLSHEPHGDSNSVGDGFVHVSHSCDVSLSAAVCLRRTDEQRQRHLEEVQWRPPDALPVMESLAPQRGEAVPQHRSAASAIAWRPPPPPSLPPPPPPPRPSSLAKVAESCYFTLESDIR